MSGGQASGFKEHDFKKCLQSGFCRRGRALAARADLAGKSWKSPYAIVGPVTVNENGEAALKAAVKSSLYPEINFSLDVRVHDDGVVRVRMDEVGGLKKRYDEVPSWTLVSEPIISKSVKWKEGKKDVRAKFGDKGDFEVVVEYEPLKLKLLRGGKEQVVLNGRGLLHLEHFRTKRVEEAKTGEEPAVEGDAQAVVQTPPARLGAWFEGDTEDDLWEETFSSWTDTKPKGTLSPSPILCNSLTCQFRPRISFHRYHVSQPRNGLWHTPTCHPSCPTLYHGQRSCIQRAVSALQQRCIRIPRLILLAITLRLHSSYACTIPRLYGRTLLRRCVRNVD